MKAWTFKKKGTFVQRGTFYYKETSSNYEKFRNLK